MGRVGFALFLSCFPEQMLTLSDMTWVSGIKVIRDSGFAACNLTLPANPEEEWRPPPADFQISLLHKLLCEFEDRFSHTCPGLQKPVPVHLELTLCGRQKNHPLWMRVESPLW